jgi:hypothetical protein
MGQYAEFYVNEYIEDKKNKLELKQKEDDYRRKLFKLDLAECIFMSYIGVRSKKGAENLTQWRRDLIKEIYPDFEKEEAKKTWDNFKKAKGKKSKILF